MSLVAAGSWLLQEVFDKGLDEAVKRVMRRRMAAARDILEEELSKGEINVADAADQDESAAMVFEYVESARQGAARRNLRMLAQIMAGALATPPIYADEFLRWSRVLADLSQEEIIVLAKLHELADTPTIQTEGVRWNEISDKLLENMKDQRVVDTKEELDSILGALERTGLVLYQGGGWDGAAWHLPSPKLDKLLAIVNLEAVLAEPTR